jgi:hypothetical protein
MNKNIKPKKASSFTPQALRLILFLLPNQIEKWH